MKQVLQDLIAKGKTRQALDELRQLSIADSDLQNEIVQIAAQFAEYERQQRLGVADHAQLGIMHNKINAALLGVVGELPEDGRIEKKTKKVLNTNDDSTGSDNSNSIMKKALYFFAFLLLAVAIYYIYAWYKAEPDNREPLPALLSAISSLITLYIAWKLDDDKNSLNSSPNNGSKRTIHQSGNKSIYIEKNKGDININ